MWQCECGEFNNEDATFCVRCNKIRVIKERARARQRARMNTDTIFRRIQDFVLLDIAFTGLITVYCFWRASQPIEIVADEHGGYVMRGSPFEAVIPVLLLVLLQLWLLIYLLRMFYGASISAERNSIFLQKIYERYEGFAEEEEEEEEEKLQPVAASPPAPGSRERRGRPRTRPPRGRSRPRDFDR